MQVAHHEELCEAAASQIAVAAAAQDEVDLANAIARAKSGLGPAHPIVVGGRAVLTQLRREHLQEERQQRVDEALLLLQGACKEEEGRAKDGGEWNAWKWLSSARTWEEARQDMQLLKEALALTRFVLGEKHDAVIAAEERAREMRDEVHKALDKANKTLHSSALEVAVHCASIPLLEQAIKNAAQSELGHNHPLVEHHKKVLEGARKTRARIAREEEENACQLMLSTALSGAQDAVSNLESAVETTYTPRIISRFEAEVSKSEF